MCGRGSVVGLDGAGIVHGSAAAFAAAPEGTGIRRGQTEGVAMGDRAFEGVCDAPGGVSGVLRGPLDVLLGTGGAADAPRGWGGRLKRLCGGSG